MNDNEVYLNQPYAPFVGGDGATMPTEFDGGGRRDYGPQGCAGIVLKTAAFLTLVAVLALLRVAGVQ